MEKIEFEKRLSKISHDLLYDSLTHDEALFKLKEVLAAIPPTKLDAKERARIFINSAQIKEELSITSRIWLEYLIVDLLESCDTPPAKKTTWIVEKRRK